MIIRRLITPAVAFAIALSVGAASSKPKSVIFIIGDGMGSAHFTAARHLRGNDFQVARMTISGWVTTHANFVVPDSAAAASAYATGQKTNHRVISVDPSGRKLTTALELAEKTGRSTGTVTTADFFDATPAAFAAHSTSRYESESIARQMLQSGAEIVAGGGAQKFGNKIKVTPEELAREYGFTLVRSGSALASARGDRVLVLFKTERNEVDSPEASLPVLARWAIGRLASNRKGFFLLLENEGTDGSSHRNATDDFIKSLRSLDETVGVALDYAAKNPDVLVLVTGDHETGGLMIQPERAGPMELKWGTRGHTGEAIPIFASGPGSERFTGLLDNTDVGKRLLELLSR